MKKLNVFINRSLVILVHNEMRAPLVINWLKTIIDLSPVGLIVLGRRRKFKTNNTSDNKCDTDKPSSVQWFIE